MWEDILPQIDFNSARDVMRRIDQKRVAQQFADLTGATTSGQDNSPIDFNRTRDVLAGNVKPVIPSAPAPAAPAVPQLNRNDFAAAFGGELWKRPASAAPWYQKTLDDIAGMSQGMAAGNAASSALNEVLARQPVNLDPSVTGARPYNPLDTGMQASPYGVTDNLMERAPVHTLGVSGFRTGWSRPTVDYGGMMERSRIENQNMRMAEMLGRQEMARNAQSNENIRTAMAVQQRDDAARAMAEQRFFGNLNRVPEGKRTPLISEGLTRGFVDPVVGGDMLLDEMLLRARMNAKTGSGIDLKRLLGSVASEFDHNKLSRLDLISKLQRMGYTADQIAAHESDPVVGGFARSLLNPDPNPKEPPLKFLGLPLFGKASRQIWEW